MRETLLVIDGRGYPDALVRVLEAQGYFCVYARGPLKAKALLKEHPVALILWKDNTGNAGLSSDLARVWKAHPQVPVVHLQAAGARAEPFELGSQVCASLPIESADSHLLPSIDRALAPTRPPLPSELDFLGAATGEAGGPSAGARSPRNVTRAPLQMPGTAVSPDEREGLFAPPPPSAGTTWSAGAWRWVRDKFARGP